MNGHKHSWSCSCWHWVGGLFWLAALAALICAWIAAAYGSAYGLDAGHWYSDAIVLGILAIPLKLKGTCNCMSK